MRQTLFGGKHPCYKANLHCHTTLSDGCLTPEQIKEAYQQQGYAIVAYSDHRQYHHHRHLNDAQFLVLAALEVDINQTGVANPNAGFKKYHFNLFDKNPDVPKNVPLPTMPYDDTAAINRYIKDLTDSGFLVSYNHPYWSMQDYNDYAPIENCFAMEIYNHGCEIDGLYGYAPQVYDEMLRRGHKLYCLATDDNHNYHALASSACDSFGGFVIIEAPKLAYEPIMHALENGAFYASMGPEIQTLYIEDGVLHIQSSPVEKIYVVTQTQRCYMRLAEPGQTITDAVFKLDGKEGYIRVDCKDGRGCHAVSNAYFV